MSEENENQVPQETIDRALSMGWIPKEQFKGDETKWRPADEYVQRAEELMPIMKSQLGKYEEKIGRYESEMSALKQNLSTQKETTEKLIQMSKKVGEQAYERAKKDIQALQAQAVADGDVEKWQRLEDQKDNLQKPEEIKVETQQPQNPMFIQWKTNNDWYEKDQDVAFFADRFGERLAQQNPSMAYADILSAVETKVKEVFPHKFENPNRNQVSAVDTSSQRTSTGTTGTKTYNDLPAYAKEQCDAFIASGTIKTKEQYVADFFDLEEQQKTARGM